MTFAIITHVPHIFKDGRYYAYGPYVREMNIWGAFVSEFIIVAPLRDGEPDAIDVAYDHKRIRFIQVAEFSIASPIQLLRSVLKIPVIVLKIAVAMHRSQHIHLRCPGNMGLLGCIVQMFFPSRPKTAKYAGNWDPKSPRPSTYSMQRHLLSNTLLSRNMQVLVYGEWPGSTRNIKPFFTASYPESEIVPVTTRKSEGQIRFLFSGMLVAGKNPLYALELIKALKDRNHDVSLHFYGEGPIREALETEIERCRLSSCVFLMGNVQADVLKAAYRESHFVLLPSMSEGWPKAIAEAMFWKCVPAALPVSCIPYMLADGERGILLSGDTADDATELENAIRNHEHYYAIAERAAIWSRQYTTDLFRSEIQKLLS